MTEPRTEDQGEHAAVLLDLVAWLDGELDAARAAEVAAHVRSCQACEAEHQALQAVSQALDRLGRCEARPEAVDAVEALALRSAAASAAPRGLVVPFPLRWLAAAAAVLLAAGLTWLALQAGGTPGRDPVPGGDSALRPELPAPRAPDGGVQGVPAPGPSRTVVPVEPAQEEPGAPSLPPGTTPPSQPGAPREEPGPGAPAVELVQAPAPEVPASDDPLAGLDPEEVEVVLHMDILVQLDQAEDLEVLEVLDLLDDLDEEELDEG